MSNMKKILGILLAVCFVLSVTAAAASAGSSPSKDGKNNVNQKDQCGGKEKKCFEKVDKKEKKYDQKSSKKTWMKGHNEKKTVKQFGKKKVGQKYVTTVVYKIIYVWIPGFWSYCGNFNACGYKFC